MSAVHRTHHSNSVFALQHRAAVGVAGELVPRKGLLCNKMMVLDDTSQVESHVTAEDDAVEEEEECVAGAA